MTVSNILSDIMESKADRGQMFTSKDLIPLLAERGVTIPLETVEAEIEDADIHTDYDYESETVVIAGSEAALYFPCGTNPNEYLLLVNAPLLEDYSDPTNPEANVVEDTKYDNYESPDVAVEVVSSSPAQYTDDNGVYDVIAEVHVVDTPAAIETEAVKPMVRNSSWF